MSKSKSILLVYLTVCIELYLHLQSLVRNLNIYLGVRDLLMIWLQTVPIPSQSDRNCSQTKTSEGLETTMSTTSTQYSLHQLHVCQTVSSLLLHGESSPNPESAAECIEGIESVGAKRKKTL